MSEVIGEVLSVSVNFREFPAAIGEGHQPPRALRFDALDGCALLGCKAAHHAFGVSHLLSPLMLEVFDEFLLRLFKLIGVGFGFFHALLTLFIERLPHHKKAKGEDAR